MPVFLIILFVVQGIFFVGMYPLWEGSDEHSHFAYVQHITENKKLPTENDSLSLGVYVCVRSGVCVECVWCVCVNVCVVCVVCVWCVYVCVHVCGVYVCS